MHRYARVFHPQILLHQLIANRILFEVTNRRMEQQDLEEVPEVLEPITSCSIPSPGSHVLSYKKMEAGKEVDGGTKLRILPVGDSITVGFPSDGDGDGYRRQLRDNLSGKAALPLGDVCLLCLTVARKQSCVCRY